MCASISVSFFPCSCQIYNTCILSYVYTYIHVCIYTHTHTQTHMLQRNSSSAYDEEVSEGDDDGIFEEDGEVCAHMCMFVCMYVWVLLGGRSG
jgi:hypothetical protein